MRRIIPLLVSFLAVNLFTPAEAGIIFTLGSNNAPEVTGLSEGGSGSRWEIGAGWGDDLPNENLNPDRLGAEFDVSDVLPGHSFLLEVGESHTFSFGTITFTESHGAGAIQPNETDRLDLLAFINFDLPGLIGGPIVATVTAFAGPINGSGGENGIADLIVVFPTPVLFSFGAGGQFSVDLSGVSFSKTDEGAKPVDATVTLLSAPTTTDFAVASAPEPSTLVMLGMGFLTLAGARLKRGSRERAGELKQCS